MLAGACVTWAASSTASDLDKHNTRNTASSVIAQAESSHDSTAANRGQANSDVDSNKSAPGAATSKSDSTPSADAGLGGEAALARNLALYESGQYEACVLGLRQLLDATNGPKLLRPDQTDQAETYLGACLEASGRVDEADQVFTAAIRNNPQMRAPDNLVFPQTVVDRFLRVRERLLTDIRRAERNRVQDAEVKAQQQDAKRKKELWVNQKLKALAKSELVIEKNKRWLASVPFGVGQFQNGDNTAGWIFLGLEAALASTCITAVIVDENLANRTHEPGIDIKELSAKRTDAYRVIVASSWAFLGVAAGGIIHAHWRFVPERHFVRARPLPSELETSETGNETPIHRGESRPSSGWSLTGIQLGQGIGIVGEF